MKKLYSLFCIALFPSLCPAQIFPAIQRSMVTEVGVYTCEPCYTWAKPMLDYFKSTYGGHVICYSQEITGYAYPLSTTLNMDLTDWAYINKYGEGTVTPVMYINQYMLDHTSGDSAFLAVSQHMIDTTNSAPCVASPIFSVTPIGSDSMIIVTETKFLQAANGNYHIGILLLQDSIYYAQNGALGGAYYHMHELTGPDVFIDIAGWHFQGNDSFSYTMADGVIPVNSIFSNTFHFKLKSTQVMSQMRPVAVVWRYDTVAIYDQGDSTWYEEYKLIYVNANEVEGFYNTFASLGIDQAGPTPYTAFVYPNPALNQLNIKLEGVPEQVTLSIYDIAGHKVLTAPVTNRQTIDVSRLGNGNYTYDFRVKGNQISNGKVEIIR